MDREPTISQSALRLAATLSHTAHRSGEEIAREFNCTRAAVWKQVQTLRELGVGIAAETGKGYRLESPLELLDRDRIMACVAGRGLQALEILPSTDSTNSRLRRRSPGERHARAVLAEHQRAGRGRRGRSWHSPFARNVYLSLGWRFDTGLGDLSCLPLVVAIAAARGIDAAGVAGVRLKWPNDLMLGGRKAGGCLVEVEGDVNGPCLAVMGIGINVHLTGEPAAGSIGQDWTDLGTQCADVSRNEVAAHVLRALLGALETFSRAGFEPFRVEWRERDLLAGRIVRLYRDGDAIEGLARGVGERGGLLVEQSGQVTEFLAGEVTGSRPEGWKGAL